MLDIGGDGAKSFGVARSTTSGDRQSGTLHFNSKCCASSHSASLHCIPMSDEWDFVDSWLDNVLNSQCLKTASLKSAPISPRDGIARTAQQISPPSPPPSAWPGRPSYTHPL